MSGTSADDKLLGFEYQFFYFLLALLKMNKDEIVGFEVKEDIHIENKEELTLCQLKHTIQTNRKVKPVNLTTSDNDLWKTLSLWTDIINKKTNKIVFLQNTKFIFVSNKSDNDKNKFLMVLKNFQNDNNIKTLCEYLEKYQDDLEKIYVDKLTKDSKGKKDKKIDYIANILSLDNKAKELFFKQMEFTLGLDNIIDEIKDELQYTKSIKKSRIDKLFNELTGSLKEDFFQKVRNRQLVQYSAEDFHIKTIPYFNNARSTRLPFQKLESYSRDISAKDMIFAKQLADIDLTEEEIYDSDYNRILIESNIKRLYQDGEITDDDIELFEENTIESWKEDFNQSYIDDKDKTINTAKKLFYSTIKKDLVLAGQVLEWKRASKGQFISMSNIPLIGWKHNWESEYKNEK